MKGKLFDYRKTILLCVIFTHLLPFTKAQSQIKKERFIIKTNEPSKLRIIENNHETEFSTLRKTGKGYLLEYQKPDKVFIKTVEAKQIAFQVIRTRDEMQSPKIELLKGDSINLNMCFAQAYSMNFNSSTDIWTKILNFILQPLKEDEICTAQPPILRAIPKPNSIHFTTTKQTFLAVDSVKIEWENLSDEKNVTVVLKNKNEKKSAITKQEQSTNFFPNQYFPKDTLKAGNEYQLSVEVAGETFPYLFNFDILSDKEIELLRTFLGMELLGVNKD